MSVWETEYVWGCERMWVLVSVWACVCFVGNSMRVCVNVCECERECACGGGAERGRERFRRCFDRTWKPAIEREQKDRRMGACGSLIRHPGDGGALEHEEGAEEEELGREGRRGGGARSASLCFSWCWQTSLKAEAGKRALHEPAHQRAPASSPPARQPRLLSRHRLREVGAPGNNQERPLLVGENKTGWECRTGRGRIARKVTSGACLFLARLLNLGLS